MQHPTGIMNPGLRSMPPGMGAIGGQIGVPQLGGGYPNMGMPRGQNMMQGMPPFAGITSEQQEKKKEFAKGIFVSGFEKTVTTEMLQKHFNIKPIHGLRHPVTKMRESKGFAFIYYGSQDDAMYVKKTLDRSTILRDKIRITRTVIPENISKMMFKLKIHGLKEEEITKIEKDYFNDEHLEKEVERIIRPVFGNNFEINKITIPYSKTAKKNLRYARVFFYVGNLKEASNVAKRSIDEPVDQTNTKNDYEVTLSYISELLNKDETFGKLVKSEIYEYTKKNQSNVLHLKGVKYHAKEDPQKIKEEIQEFIRNENPQWNIVSVYAAIYEKMGAWANVTFSTYEETIQAYEHMKNKKPKFREEYIYGSVRNVKDPRTVVISVVRKDATEKDMGKFLDGLAKESPKINAETSQVRRYDFFSHNIIQSKKFFKNNEGDIQGIFEADASKVEPSWIEINEVPRRLIIHFMNDLTEEDIKQLINTIKVQPDYDRIFLSDGDNKRQLRSNHQKGHVNKAGIYVKHTDLKPRRKARNNQADPNKMNKRIGGGNQRGKGPRKPSEPTNIMQYGFGNKGGMPKLGNYRQNIPGIGVPGSSNPPPMGMNPPMGGARMPPPSSTPMMGGIPTGSVGGSFKPYMGGNPPPMGGNPPQMGGNPPPMGGQIGHPPPMMPPSNMMGSNQFKAGNMGPPPPNKGSSMPPPPPNMMGNIMKPQQPPQPPK